MFTKIKIYFTEIEAGYSRLQKIFYNLKRHFVPVIALIAGMSIMLMFKDWEIFSKNIELLLVGVQRVGIGLILYLLISKFAFPKLNIQDELIKGNLSMSVFIGSLIISIALLF